MKRVKWFLENCLLWVQQNGLAFIMVVVVASFMLWLVSINNHYRVNAKVLTVYEDTVIMFITEDGNTWLVDDVDTTGVHVGDVYHITFNDVNEDGNIYNDEIIKYERAFK